MHSIYSLREEIKQKGRVTIDAIAAHTRSKMVSKTSLYLSISLFDFFIACGPPWLASEGIRVYGDALQHNVLEGAVLFVGWHLLHRVQRLESPNHTAAGMAVSN